LNKILPRVKTEITFALPFSILNVFLCYGFDHAAYGFKTSWFKICIAHYQIFSFQCDVCCLTANGLLFNVVPERFLMHLRVVFEPHMLEYDTSMI